MPLSSVVVRSALHAGVFALAVAIMTVTPLIPVDAQKGKPIPNPTANLKFADSDGDAVTSDSAGTYFHGVDGFEATVFTSPSYSSSGDLVVQFGSSRHIKVNLQSPMGLTGGTVQGPTGMVAAGGMFVQAIGFIEEGATEARVARIGKLAGLANHAIGFRMHTNTEPETLVNGTPVCVTRHTSSSWTIFTTASGECPGGGEVGALFAESSKKGKTVHTFVARYALPFSVYVELQQ